MLECSLMLLIVIRSCPFSQGDIYWPQGTWSQRWGLNNPEGNSKGFCGVNPSSATTARPGGILFEISPLENSHDLLSYMEDTNSLVSLPRHLKGISIPLLEKRRIMIIQREFPAVKIQSPTCQQNIPFLLRKVQSAFTGKGLAPDPDDHAILFG